MPEQSSPMKSSPMKRPKSEQLAGFISKLSPKKKCYYFDVQHGPDKFTKVQGFGLDSTYQKLKQAEGSCSPMKLTGMEKTGYSLPVFNDNSKLDRADPITEVIPMVSLS